MLCMQASIGVANDIVDAPLDAGQKPAKPIPVGLVSPQVAAAVAVILGLVGLLLSLPSGAGTVAVAAVGLGLGYAYDVRLSRGGWSWLPLSLALPLSPIHAWLGASGVIPPGLLTLVPTAVLAGAALAIANGLVDVDRDTRAGRRPVAVELGRHRAWLVHVGLLAIVAAAAVFIAPGIPVSTPSGQGSTQGGGGLPIGFDALRALRSVGTGLGIALLPAGALALAASRPSVRERGWELEALGIAVAGIGWLAGTAATAASP
jgi:hypothetical protein